MVTQMDSQKKFKSLSDLEQLLPESKSERHLPVNNLSKLKHDGKGKSVRVVLDTKGRKGKTVTLIFGMQHNPKTMEEIARILKQHCGAGGTVKDGKIEIQGDNRDKVADKLREMNYIVK
jgi:predicted translation initiation factor SUI1